MKLYFIEYINDVLISDTNKLLNSAIKLSEYFCVIGCHLIMACYVGHSIRDFFLKDPITPHKGTPIRLNYIISGRRLENITRVMYCTNLAILEFNDPFFQHRHIHKGWNNNMAEHFDSSWVSVLDESIQEWIDQYNFLGWIFPPRKPHPFENKYHTIVCAKSKVIYNVDIVEGKY